jgi:Terminase large subunit, T4likevirus-type, N-terminal
MQELFHVGRVAERILRGSNRGGKTLPAAVEVARALTGQDPYGKYPKTNGRCYAVGKNGKHISQVMWRKLAIDSGFKIIRDEASHLWRAYRPWVPADSARESETRPALPLIPPRFIRSISYENKKEGQPSTVKFVNGWELVFWSSEGNPPRGSDVDLVWFDEEIVVNDWYSEMSARLLDRAGRFIWSATPQTGTQQLYDLSCRAADNDPLVQEFLILLAANPHIKQSEKDKLVAKLSDEERRVRIDGEFALTSFKIYPEFSTGTHNCPWFAIPEDWMRLCAIDPGRQVCAVLFLAVPPPAANKPHVYLYDELYIRGADAEKFGVGMKEKVGQHGFHVFLIDGHAAQQGEIGSGRTVEQQYRDALKRHEVKSKTTAYGFKWGADDPAAGILAFRHWLRIQSTGKPKLQILENTCPMFRWEIGRYHYARQRDLVTDKPEKKHDHLMDCGRYLAMYDPKYAKPEQPKKRESYAVKALREKRERARARRGADADHITLGPGGSYGTHVRTRAG